MSITGKCSHCNRKASNKEKFINCDFCKNSIHIGCEDIDNATANSIISMKKHMLWLCSKCKEKNPLDMLQLIPRLIEKQEELTTKLEEMCSEKIKDSKENTEPHIDLFKELDEIRTKEKGVVLFGFNTSSNDLRKDVTDLFTKDLGVNVEHQIKRVHATKKNSATVFVDFIDKAPRDSILRNARRLKDSTNPSHKKLYIKPQLTALQLQKEKKIREEFKSRKSNGEDVFIRDGKILTRRSDKKEEPKSD